MRFLLLLFLLLSASVGSAQRAFKPIKAALKAKNYKEVIAQVAKLRADTTDDYRLSPKLCLYNIEAYRGLNDAQNLKLYLKQSYDTVAFFSTTHQIIQEAVRLDSIERQLQQTENKKPRETAFVVEQLRRYFPNIPVAARFFYKRKKFAEAMPYLRTSLDLPHTPIGIRSKLLTKQDTINAGLYLMTAFQLKQYGEVHRYSELALQDTVARKTLIECLVYTAEAQQNPASYHHWLQTGWKDYPLHKMFFTRLADYYAARGDHKEVVRLATQQLQIDSTDISALLARSMAELYLEHYDASIADGRNILQLDSANAEANYYIGAAYAAQALKVVLPDNVLSRSYRTALKQQQLLYTEAKPYLETYRERAPQHQNRWAPLLYKVYLALNEGSKFAEIEALLKK